MAEDENELANATTIVNAAYNTLRKEAQTDDDRQILASLVEPAKAIAALRGAEKAFFEFAAALQHVMETRISLSADYQPEHSYKPDAAMPLPPLSDAEREKLDKANAAEGQAGNAL